MGPQPSSGRRRSRAVPAAARVWWTAGLLLTLAGTVAGQGTFAPPFDSLMLWHRLDDGSGTTASVRREAGSRSP